MKTLFFGNSAKSVPKKVVQIHADPAIYLVHNFLSKGELEYFDIMCTHYERKFQASFTGTDNDDEVISEERTSKFVHLSKSQDKYVRGIEQKAADLVGLSPVNVEPLQIVSYQPGQRFNLHHDAGTLLEDGRVPAMVPPRRLVTMFLYLNSLPEGEGHTVFPCLNLSVRPQRNCALMFCNTTIDSSVACPLAVHCAQPLSSAPRHPSKCCKKFGVNIWLTDTDLTELVGNKTRTPLPRPFSSGFAEPSNSKRKRQRAVTNMGNELESVHTTDVAACSIRSDENVPVEGVLALAERMYQQWLAATTRTARSELLDDTADREVHNLKKMKMSNDVICTNASDATRSPMSCPPASPQRTTPAAFERAQTHIRGVSLVYPTTGRTSITRRVDNQEGS